MKQRPLWFKALLILLPAMLGLAILGCVGSLPKMARGRADFRQLYVAGFMVRTGRAADLYDYNAQLQWANSLVSREAAEMPFLRPAHQALLFAPLSYLPYRAAYFVWAGLNTALVAILCLLLRGQYPTLERAWEPLPQLALGAFFPLWLGVLLGQDTILLLAIFLVALLALRKDREALAGAICALGLFKFQIVLPVAGLFLLWKRWKFVRGFAAVALLLAAVSFAMIGVPGIDAFWDSITRIHYPVRYDQMCNLHAALVGLFGNSLRITLATVVLSAVAWLAVARWSPAKAGAEALMVALATAALVSYYLCVHDACVLILPMLFTMDHGMKRSFGGWVCLAMFLGTFLSIFAPQRVFLTAIPVLLLVIATTRAAARRTVESSTSPIEAVLEAVSEPAGGSN